MNQLETKSLWMLYVALIFGVISTGCRQDLKSALKNGFKKSGSSQNAEEVSVVADAVGEGPLPGPANDTQPLPASQVPSGPVDLNSEVTQVFLKHCISCHGKDAVQGNFGSLENIEILAGNKKLIAPGAPNDSLLFKKLAPQGNMPPGGNISPSEVKTIYDWITSLKLPETLNVPTTAQMIQSVAGDLKQLSLESHGGVRYFALHLGGGKDAQKMDLGQIDVIRKGLFKTLNSLSKASLVIKPLAIDPEQLIYRVNLNEFGISPAVFDKLVEDFYPFQVSEPFWRKVSPEASELYGNAQTILKTGHFLIRADWFVATAMLPIPYEILMEHGKDHSELDARLGIDRKSAIASNQVVRAGLATSGVSTQNRVVERFSQPNGQSYWLSYDFASVDQNIFENPLGPLGTFASRQFEHDGGELIYQLPNGMLAFRLVDSLGQAIDKGPTSIVEQADGHPQFASAIVNGISCMGCHSAGLIPVKDDVRKYAESNKEIFTSSELEKILSLYPESGVLQDALLRDNQAYSAALGKIGLNTKDTDPVNQTFQIYQRPLDRSRVAAELQTDTAAIERILQEKPFKSAWWSLRLHDSISRENFNRLVRQAWASIHGADSVSSPAVGDYSVTPLCMFKDLVQMDLCFVDK